MTQDSQRYSVCSRYLPSSRARLIPFLSHRFIPFFSRLLRRTCCCWFCLGSRLVGRQERARTPSWPIPAGPRQWWFELATGRNSGALFPSSTPSSPTSSFVKIMRSVAEFFFCFGLFWLGSWLFLFFFQYRTRVFLQFYINQQHSSSCPRTFFCFPFSFYYYFFFWGALEI